MNQLQDTDRSLWTRRMKYNKHLTITGQENLVKLMELRKDIRKQTQLSPKLNNLAIGTNTNLFLKSSDFIHKNYKLVSPLKSLFARRTYFPHGYFVHFVACKHEVKKLFRRGFEIKTEYGYYYHRDEWFQCVPHFTAISRIWLFTRKFILGIFLRLSIRKILYQKENFDEEWYISVPVLGFSNERIRFKVLKGNAREIFQVHRFLRIYVRKIF